MENISVEELSRKLEGDRTVIIQEVTTQKQRQWVFQGERLKEVKERGASQADFSNAQDVIFVCEEMKQCEEQARKMRDNVNVGYLAGGFIAWGQFYHPVMVGFDEGIKVWQIHRLAKGCLSYLICSGQDCIVIDPCYHIDYYLGLAHSQRGDIKCVIDTKIHTDHVSGAARLSAKTSSPYYVPSHMELQGKSQPLEQQSVISVNQAKLEVIPLSDSSQPQDQSVGLLLNNQYLFVGDTPLDVVRQKMAARKHNQSNQTLLVLPAHLKTLGRVNQHGIVAAAIDFQNANETVQQEQMISVSQPEAKENDILKVNLSQEVIDLDTANQLEMGLDHTP